MIIPVNDFLISYESFFFLSWLFYTNPKETKLDNILTFGG